MAFNSCTRVLIVEDDAIIAIMMESMVEDLGYRVVGPSTNFTTALQTAESAELDFALLDFALDDGRDAGEIAEVLTKRGIPFAFTTGAAPNEIRTVFKNTPIISKPVVEEELIDLLP